VNRLASLLNDEPEGTSTAAAPATRPRELTCSTSSNPLNPVTGEDAAFMASAHALTGHRTD
jgi:hypothetical protein